MHNVFKLVLFSLVFGTVSCFAYDPYSKTYNVTVEALFDPLLVPLKKLEDETNRCMNQRPVGPDLGIAYHIESPVSSITATTTTITKLESQKALKPIAAPIVSPVTIVLPKPRGKDVAFLIRPASTKRFTKPDFQAPQNPASIKRVKN